jgi:hypothetical protein
MGMRGRGMTGSMQAAALLASFALGQAAWAGAWPMEEGRRQTISSATYDAADSGFDAGGDASLSADFEKIESSIYLEWGVTDRLTLFAQPTVQQVSSVDENGELHQASGFGSSQVGAQVLIARGFGGVLSAQGALVAPGAAENVISARLGEGGAASDLRLAAGRGWGGEHSGVWIEGQVGHRWRFDEYPNEARLDATFGVRASPNWMVMAQSFSLWREAETAVSLRESRSHKAQLSLVRKIDDRWSVQLGGFGTYAGRNVVEERAAFLALWRRFNP